MRAPTKVQGLLDAARAAGLAIEFIPDEGKYLYPMHTWSITSGSPNDHDALWIYWIPGANGGRVRLVRYRPHAARKPSRVTRLTYARARVWLSVLATGVRTAA